jgi:hypothetical protein
MDIKALYCLDSITDLLTRCKDNGTALVMQDSLQHLVYIQVLRSVRGADKGMEYPWSA